MHDPRRIVFNSRWLMILRHENGDRPIEFVTWREKLDPRRYEFCFRPGTAGRWYVNKDACWRG